MAGRPRCAMCKKAFTPHPRNRTKVTHRQRICRDCGPVAGHKLASRRCRARKGGSGRSSRQAPPASLRLAAGSGPDGMDLLGRVFLDEPSSLGPAAEPTQGLQPAVDRRGLEPLDLDEVLAVGRDVEGCEGLQRRLGWGLLLEPPEEQRQVESVTDDGPRAGVRLRQARGELGEPGIPGLGGWVATCAQCHPPG